MIKQLLLLCLCGQFLVAFGNKFEKIEVVNKDFINHLNSIEGSWTAGFNFPDGTSLTELQVLLGAKLGRLPETVINNDEIPQNVVIPKSFDARTKWPHCKSIRSIKNQGHCGSCWAVSSATTMSDRLCISSKGKFRQDISAQQVTSCSEGNGCRGGWPSRAWTFFIEQGAVTGGNYGSRQGCQPYLVEPCINRTINLFSHSPQKCESSDYVTTPQCVKKCYNRRYKKSFAKDLHKGLSVYGVPRNIEKIQYDLMTYGPSVVAISVYADFLTYRSGVYEPKTTQTVGGHALRLLGWGEQNGVPYWLLANQWGPEWGEKGTVKFLRGKDVASVESYVVAGHTGKK